MCFYKIHTYLPKENKLLQESKSKNSDSKLREKYQAVKADRDRFEAKVKKQKTKIEKLTEDSEEYKKLLQKIADKQF